MDKSSITWTKGSDWWLSRMTMGGKERYPKQIRVGDLDRPRVYYPVDCDALLTLANEMEGDARYWLDCPCDQLGSHDVLGYAHRIREALGVER